MLLDRPTLFREHQGFGMRAELQWGQPDHLGKIHHTQNILDFLGIVIRSFLEDQDFGVVIDRESFFGILVVQAERPDGGVGGENLDQLEP